jgi:hypothetical protein
LLEGHVSVDAVVSDAVFRLDWETHQEVGGRGGGEGSKVNDAALDYVLPLLEKHCRMLKVQASSQQSEESKSEAYGKEVGMVTLSFRLVEHRPPGAGVANEQPRHERRRLFLVQNEGSNGLEESP